MDHNHTLFSKTNKKVLKIIKNLNIDKNCTFLIPTKFITAEASQVGYLLNVLLNKQLKNKRKKKYKCFFSSSGFEALQAAIKIARHNFFLKKKNMTHEIYIYSSNKNLDYHFNIISSSSHREIIPEITLVSNFGFFIDLMKFNNQLYKNSYIIRVGTEIESKKIEEASTWARKSNSILIIDVSELKFENAVSFIRNLSFTPDVLIWGEALTDYQVPFGTCIMSDKIYKPWDRFDTCFLHSSTYGGNRLALKYVLSKLLSPKLLNEDYEKVREYCEHIKNNQKILVKAFAKYVNPGLVFLYSMAGFTLTPLTSSGSKLTFFKKGDKKRQVIDFISGAGAAIRGHCPNDIIEEVINIHDKKKDYVKDLSKRLSELTELAYLFPAVSGATAVDIALTLALTGTKKEKILTFKGNYSGKTLFSLSLSEGAEIQQPFAPLYPEVIFLDPFSSDASEKLIEIIKSHKLALIWFEYIQGSTCCPIPKNLIQIINQYKKKYGYFIGVDEVLMGIYRNGTFLSFEGQVESPDIITFSKALSDGTFPMSATLISELLYQNIKKENPYLIKYFSEIYRNQLGAHIALHVIDKISKSIEFRNNVKNVEELLNTGFKKISSQSPIIENIEGIGLMYKISYNLKSRLLNIFGRKIAEFTLILYLTNLYFKKADILVFFDRCIPSLTISESEVKQALEKLEVVTRQNEPFFQLRILIYQLKILFYYALRIIKFSKYL